jgi:hypothetical protein
VPHFIEAEDVFVEMVFDARSFTRNPA